MIEIPVLKCVDFLEVMGGVLTSEIVFFSCLPPVVGVCRFDLEYPTDAREVQEDEEGPNLCHIDHRFFILLAPGSCTGIRRNMGAFGDRRNPLPAQRILLD